MYSITDANVQMHKMSVKCTKFCRLFEKLHFLLSGTDFGDSKNLPIFMEVRSNMKKFRRRCLNNKNEFTNSII